MKSKYQIAKAEARIQYNVDMELWWLELCRLRTKLIDTLIARRFSMLVAEIAQLRNHELTHLFIFGEYPNND